MVPFNSLRIMASIISLLPLPLALAGQQATVNFDGSIINGSCNISVQNSVIQFGPHKLTSFAPNTAVAVRPVDADIDCTNSTTPSVTVTAAAGTTQFPGTPVFRGAASTSTGIGFMVRKDIAGGIPVGAFYNAAQAITSTPVSLAPVVGTTSSTERFILGLVQPPATIATAGTVVAKITLNVHFN